jgi:hypothetical protein
MGASVGLLAIVPAARADSPPGFWNGSDSWPVPVGGAHPYSEPRIGGTYGGYIGMIGSWEWWLGCHGAFLAWSQANSNEANLDLTRYHSGIGTGAYWFMGGPGVDPSYNGTAQEAYDWGERQAVRAVSDLHQRGITYPVLILDVELPGIKPAPDNGWNSVYTSPCSGTTKATFIPARIDRADFNGFYDYVKARSAYIPGVYSAPATWQAIFGPGSTGSIPRTYEWTYEPETGDLTDAPTGWCLKGSSSCADWFGGVTSSSPQALIWQWSGGGGLSNGVGDFDQIDAKVIHSPVAGGQ